MLFRWTYSFETFFGWNTLCSFAGFAFGITPSLLALAKKSDDPRLDLFDLIDPDTDVLNLHSVDIQPCGIILLTPL